MGRAIRGDRRGIKNGVRKINIDTDCRLAMSGIIRKVAEEQKNEFDLRKFLKPARDAMEEVCIDRFERFGASGQADKIKPLSLKQMAGRYQIGELEPIIS